MVNGTERVGVSVSCRDAGSLAGSLSGNLGIPGGDTFLGCGIIFGLAVRARASGRSFRTASKVGVLPLPHTCRTSA